MGRIAYLDGWRASAVLAVLFAHFVTSRGINLGRVGVELFFVLSGRLMAEILFTHEMPLSSFYRRRFIRVFPALLVFAAMMLVLPTGKGNTPTAAQFFTAITFTSNYLSWWSGRSPVLDHIWSLCIEEHMYLLLGGIALLSRRMNIPVIGTLLVLAVLGLTHGMMLTAFGYGYYDVYWRSDVRGASILIGSIAYLLAKKYTITDTRWRWASIILFIFGGILNLNFVPDPIKYSIGTTCFAFSLVLLGKSPRIIISHISSRFLTKIGIWSYSIYLWQQPFSKLGGDMDARILNFSIAILFSLFSFYLIENPARKFFNEINKKSYIFIMLINM